MAHRNPNGEGAALEWVTPIPEPVEGAEGAPSRYPVGTPQEATSPVVEEIANAVQRRIESSGRGGSRSGLQQWSMILGLVVVILMLGSQIWGWGKASGELATKDALQEVALEARDHADERSAALDKRVDKLEKALIGIRKDIGIIAEEIRRERD